MQSFGHILFGDNHVQNNGNCKKGDALRTTLVLKIRLISTKKCHTEEKKELNDGKILG
jgi:hypothetical protein